MGDEDWDGDPAEGVWGEGIGDPGGSGAGPDLGGGVELDELPFLKTGEVGGIGQCFQRLMGDFDPGEAVFRLKITEQMSEVAAAWGIEMGEGFVEEEEGGFGEEGAGEGDAGGFAAGELGRSMLETLIDAEARGQFLDLLLPGVGGDVMDAEGEVELVGDREMGEEGGVLGHPTASAQLRWAMGPIDGIEVDLAGIRGIESGDEA